MELAVSDCSWEKDRAGKHVVCSSAEVIEKMAEFLKSMGKTIDPSLSGEDADVAIVEQMKEVTECKSESCVVQDAKFKEFASPYVVEKNLKENFKTKGPAHTSEWLSNFNIDDVLDKIREAYADQNFWNIPFQMRDFKKTRPNDNADRHMKDSNLETFDIVSKYREGYRCFGVAINTDYSSGGGIHWFCLFICMRGPDITIEYFNSSGAPPLAEIDAWMTKTRLLLEKEFPDKKVSKVIASKVEHQTDNHSCGVYALYYIISRVAGIPYTHFQQKIINSKAIREIRGAMFRSDR
jgi:hypothetical protein